MMLEMDYEERGEKDSQIWVHGWVFCWRGSRGIRRDEGMHVSFRHFQASYAS